MTLIYKGESGKVSVNGRPMKNGMKITDPQEIADLTGQDGFEDDTPPKKNGRGKKKES